MRKILKYSIIGVVVLLALVVLLAPFFVKGYVNKNGKELVGRKLHIEKLKLNLFTTTVKVIDFTMFEADEKQEFLGFDTLIVNMKPLKLFKKELYLQQLLLANPHGTVIKEDLEFNFSDLATPDTSKTIPPDEMPENEKTEKAAYRLNLNDLEMRNGNFSYIDKVVDNSIHIHSLSFVIPQIYWNASDSSKADLAFQLSEGGTFESDVNYDVESKNFTGFIDIKGLELKTILPYLKSVMRFSDMHGTYETNLKFSGNADNPESLTINGYMAVDNLLLLDSDGDSIAGVQQNLIAFNEVKPMQQHIIIDSIHIEKPFGTFVIIDSTQTNWSKLMVAETETEVDSTAEILPSDTLEPAADKSEQELYIQLNKLNINNGTFTYKDLQFDTTFIFSISQFMVGMDSVIWEQNRMTVNTTMDLNQSGHLESKIEFNPNSMMDSFLMEYVLSGLALSDFDLYTRKFIGYAVNDGKLYLTGNTQIIDSILISENDLNIRSIDMGDKEGGQYDVPVKTALFLIKDNNDNVHLDLPIEGDLSDPNTSIGGLVAKKLTEFVFKIIKSPFKFIGGIVGLEAGEMSNIPFEYSDVKKLNETQKKSLNNVIKYATKNPDVVVELFYLNDKSVEAKILAKEWAENEFHKKEKKNANSHSKAYQNFLVEQTQQSNATIEQMEEALAPQNKIDREIEQREKQRMKMVQEYLKKHDESSLIKVHEFDASNETNKESIPRLNAHIGLKSQHE